MTLIQPGGDRESHTVLRLQLLPNDTQMLTMFSIVHYTVESSLHGQKSYPELVCVHTFIDAFGHIYKFNSHQMRLNIHIFTY